MSPQANKFVLSGLLKLMRPRQWVKNGFVLAPLAFSNELFFVTDAAVGALGATLLFCVASSSAYIINDIRDIERDRNHPVKSRTRPLASGAVSVRQALVLLVGLFVILALGFFKLPSVGPILAGYLVLNLAYSFFLKRQPVIDIFTIAICFVLRVFAGATAIAVDVSSWMFVTTLSLGLYLAAVKRRQELALSGPGSRKVLEHYTVSLVDRYAEMSATGALVFYSLFVISEKPELVVTIPFVLYGLFRYWFVVDSLNGGESPTDSLLGDWQLALTVILWIGACIWIMWPAGS